MTHRADPRAVLHHRALDDRRPDQAAGTDRAVDDLGAGADRRPLADGRRSAEDHVRLERDVLGQRDRRVEIHRRGVTHRDPGPHVGAVDPGAEVPFGLGELRPVVDPEQPPVVLDGQRDDQPAVRARELHELGQVQLAGLRRPAERSDPLAQPGGVERVQPRVDLVDRDLLVGRVLALDDPLDGPGVVAHDAAEVPGIDRIDGDERDRRLIEPALDEELFEERGLEEGRVAGEDEELVDVVGEGGERRRDRITGPARLGLERVVHVVAEGVADGGGGGARDDQWSTARRLTAGIDHVGDHRPARKLVNQLRPARLHARAETGRHHDGGHVRRRAGTWRVHEERRERARVGEDAIPTRSGPGAWRGGDVIER